MREILIGDRIMDSFENNKCKRCGALISAKSTEKLCPACLMSGVIKAPDAHADTISMTSGESILRYENSDLPCEFGGYRLLKLLGRGGMGTVYEAQQIATGRRVALKMLGRQLDSSDLRQRFLREGRLAASVSHPNSLYVFGSEEVDGLPVITMEIAGGGTLKDKLKKNGPFKVTQAVDATLDVISGLESAFVGGVLHRDIKPSNCFISPDGLVKVGDYGLSVSTLAKTDTFVTAGSKIMGTPAYASPEQLRGDALDLRADIYSVGATLFTLLTDRAPFEGDNAVQVVANAVNKKPTPLTELRKDIPSDLARVVNRCLAKEPDGRYADYKALRNALLPFSSKEPEPASLLVRVSGGWVDFLIAFLIPYVAIMLFFGSNELIVQPLVDRTLYSFRYYFAFLCCGFLYFGICEGFFGAGLGKYLKGLRVVRKDGRVPGFGRALLRIVIIIGCVECVRMPLMMALISTAEWTGFQTAMYVVAANVCGWIPVLFALRLRRENGFRTIWELASGTKVLIKPKGAARPKLENDQPEVSTDESNSIGPYKIIKELVREKWIVANDPVLRRQVWLLRRNTGELSDVRKDLSRYGRLRWLQKVDKDGVIWDTFEATKGMPFASLIKDNNSLPWSSLRYWLYDLSSELWKATGDDTLPTELSIDNVWITAQGNAILLDEPWPDVETKSESIAVGDLAGQQRFLNSVAEYVDSTSLPLHARGILQNLKEQKFEKLSFLAGILQGLLEKPAEVSKGIRAGSLFVLPFYVWIAFFVGYFHDKSWYDALGWNIITSAMGVLGVIALFQLMELPFRSTAGQFTFRLAVINSKGQRAGILNLFVRWMIVWTPLFIPILFAITLNNRGEVGSAFILAVVSLVLWIACAVYATIHPNRGLHDRLAGTWVVRQ